MKTKVKKLRICSLCSKKIYGRRLYARYCNSCAKKRSKQVLSEIRTRCKEKYPERELARYIVYHAIKVGQLTREVCVICGKPNAQGHHEDYTKPLEVVWLCVEHHQRLHSLKRKGLINSIEDLATFKERWEIEREAIRSLTQ